MPITEQVGWARDVDLINVDFVAVRPASCTGQNVVRSEGSVTKRLYAIGPEWGLST